MLLELRDERKEGEVPVEGKTAILLGAADTQDNGFVYEIRAFGYGLTQTSWQVREDFADTFASLKEAMFDSDYRTAEVYRFARGHHGRVIPLMGERKLQNPYS